MGVWWGPWSWWLARRVPRLDAFEASPNLVAQLKSAMPQNVHIHNVALSDRAGTAELWVPSGGKGSEGRSSIGAELAACVRRVVSVGCGGAVGCLRPWGRRIRQDRRRGSRARRSPRARQAAGDAASNLLVEVEQHGVEGNPFAEVVEFSRGVWLPGQFPEGTGRGIRLRKFDRVATRAMADRVAKHGYVANMIWNARRYVHNFLFRNEYDLRSTLRQPLVSLAHVRA